MSCRTAIARCLAAFELAAAAALPACTPPRMATPADLAQVADEMAVTDRSRAAGLFVNEAFNMSPYRVTRVHRGGTSSESSGWQVGSVSATKYSEQTFYDFDLQAAVGMYKGNCGMRAHDKETTLGRIIFSEPGAAGLDCNCSGGGPGVSRLVLDIRQYQGYVAHRSGATAGVEPVMISEKGGAGGFLGLPFGYEVRGNLPLGAVDVMYPGRVWISRSLDAGDRADLACLFVGLLLYRPPGTQGP